MPVLTTHYRVIVTAQHRQPRNPSYWIEPNPAEVGTHFQNTMVTPTSLALLPYVENGENKLATFLFWSLTDHGNVGETSQNLHYTPTIGSNDTEITAWYLPAGGIGTGGGPGYLVDAFDERAGAFVSDTVFTVFDASNAQNAALTTEANVVGILDTTNLERLRTLDALPSNREAFDHWITVASDGDTQPVVAGLDDTVARKTSGVAIATYRPTTLTAPTPSSPRTAWVIAGAVEVDGWGQQWLLGHLGTVVPVTPPVGPWGPYLERVARAATVAAQGSQFAAAKDLTALSLAEVLDATNRLQAHLAGNEGYRASYS